MNCFIFKTTKKGHSYFFYSFFFSLYVYYHLQVNYYHHFIYQIWFFPWGTLTFGNVTSIDTVYRPFKSKHTHSRTTLLIHINYSFECKYRFITPPKNLRLMAPYSFTVWHYYDKSKSMVVISFIHSLYWRIKMRR